MATVISTPDLYKAYLAYFGRPPDLQGLAAFSTQTEAQVIAAFSASPESQLLLASQGSVPEQVNAIYLNLFNRPAEFGGPTSATYWVVEITQGRLSVAEAAMMIMRSALGTDADSVTAKYNASVAFVAEVEAENLAASYSGLESAQDGRDFLHTVDYQNFPTQEEIDAAVVVATTPNPPPAPTYAITPDANSVNEGNSVVFTIETTNVPAGTSYSYTLSGISSDDLQVGVLTGTVTIDASGQGLVQVSLKADALTEGNEEMTLTLGAGLATASVTVIDTSITPPVPTYAITPDANSVNEGNSVVFTIETTNVPAGTSYSYTLSGISSDDLQVGVLTGTVTIDASGQGLVQVSLKADALTEGNEEMTLTLGAGLATASVTVIDTSITPEVVGVTKIATTGIDILVGTSADDTFVATNATLQNGDSFDGLAGSDKLTINFSGNSGSYYDGFETNSVELISVKNLANSGVTVDVSDVNYDNLQNGAVTLESRESRSDVSFWDIQSINDTDLRIVDTDGDTSFWYDAGSSAVNDNGNGTLGDVTELAVSEMRGTAGSGSNWYTGLDGGTTGDFGRPGVTGAGILLGNTANFGGTDESYVDVVRLNSGTSGQASPTLKNTITLTAGQDLDTLIITGDADLEITNTLDENIRVVDASAHRDPVKANAPTESADTRADLILDLSNSSDGLLYADANAFWTDDANGDGYVSGDPEDEVQGLVGLLSIKGSQGDDLITTGTTHNDKEVDLGTGNDTLVAAGWIEGPQDREEPLMVLSGGEASVNGGAGNDVITTGNHNDIVFGGDGNDKITDGGSTSLWTGNGGSGNSFFRYDADYSDYGNQFDLGAGNDTLTVHSAPNMFGGQWIWGSNNTVTAGDGNDVVSISGSAIDGNYTTPGWQRVDTIVDLGANNDKLTIGDAGVNGDVESPLGGGTYRDFMTIAVDYRASNNFGVKTNVADWGGSRGDVAVVGGDGNDAITIYRDGTHTVDSGTGSDTVFIHGDENTFTTNQWDGTASDGAHKITLGSGDDYLWITGRSVTNTQGTTTDIDAGTGNDYIQIEQDHRLNVKLGEGEDRLMMRAQDLQSADTIQGGNNYMTDAVNEKDVIYLTNETHASYNGFVDRSDTNHVYSIEEYWLLDSSIRLNMDNHMFETALNRKVVVDTTQSSQGAYPIGLGLMANGQPRFQGMVYSTWDGIVPAGVVADPVDVNRDLDFLDPVDVVYFKYTVEPAAMQTVDLSSVDTYDYSFELRGGSLKDLVIVDDDALSADLTLNFDAGAGIPTGPDSREAWSYQDTLRVLDSATLRADDMERVTNLEIIELAATQNASQEYVIELNTHVINQPSGTNDLIIQIDPNVPAGSKVAIVFSENNTLLSTNNVVVLRTSNVQVYIATDAGDPFNVGNLVTEPQMNSGVIENFGGSSFGVVVNTLYYFTENTDNLVGGSGDDMFIAQKVDDVQTADNVNGNGGTDTVQLNFAVANGSESLDDQLSNVTLTSIERIVFNTENNVTFDSIGNIAPSLSTIESGYGNDSLAIERDGLWIATGVGDDLVNFIGNGGDNETIAGGPGSDTVLGTNTDDSMTVGGVEYIETYDGADRVVYTTLSGLGGNDGNIFVTMGNFGGGGDVLVLDNDGTNGVANVDGAETIFGGDSVDTIYATSSTSQMNIWGDGDSSGLNDTLVGANDSIDAVGTSGSGTAIRIYGEQGNDWIRANTTSDLGTVFIDGGIGNDTIIGGTGTPGNVTVLGQSGMDNISVTSTDYANVDGGTENDTILVKVGNTPNANATDSVWGAAVNDSVASADVMGGTGNDTITVWTQDSATVHGNDGTDLITVYSDADGGGSTYIYGDNGSDVINVRGDANTFVDAGGDTSNDTINLQALGSGVDTIVFGNITYNALQQVATNTQGVDIINNFNFEAGVGPDTAAPGADDVLNFNAFLGGVDSGNIKYGNWIGGLTNGNQIQMDLGPDSSLAVITVDNSFTAQDLRNSINMDVGIGPGIWLDDGQRAVVILAKDSNPADALVGYDTFDVYYVQDVDTSAASAVWAVDLVATIHSTTAVGSTSGSIGAAQIVW